MQVDQGENYYIFYKRKKEALCITNRQPSNAGGFRRLALNRPANVRGKEKKQQVNPALRLPAGRYGQLKINQ
jgi:hypothetical protein